MAIKLSPPYSFLAIGQKDNQEDALWPESSCVNPNMLILCDGMGGHKNGEVASRCVADTLSELLSTLPEMSMTKAEVVINNALREVYSALNKLDVNDGAGRTMGTTLVLAIKCIDGLLVAHIGDSRMYLFRNGDGIVFRTRDHSVVSELVACGEMTEAEARFSPLKNRITKAIQPHQDSMAIPTFDRITDIKKGDVIFLCSDGIIEQITDDELVCIMTESKELSEKVNEIKSICSERNTRDNHSCIGVQIDEKDSVNKPKTSLWQTIANIIYKR